MKWTRLLEVAGFVLGIVAAGLIAASLLDIVLAVLKSRFYTEVAFVITFAVAGIFAASVAYIYVSDIPAYKSTTTHYLIIILLICCGLLFFWPLARLEGGEYEVPFKGYGAALAGTSLLFFRWNKSEKQKAP